MEAKKAAGLSLLGAQMRRSALEMVYRATSGHLGGSMSLCEILAVLYFDKMRVDPTNPGDPDRDRLREDHSQRSRTQHLCSELLPLQR